MKFFEKIISCKNDGIYRVITVLGIRFKRKNARREILAELDDLRSRLDVLNKNVKTATETATENNTSLTKTISNLNQKAKLDDLRSRLDVLNKNVKTATETVTETVTENNTSLTKTISNLNQKTDYLRQWVDVQGMTIRHRITQVWETECAPQRYYENKFEFGFLEPFFNYMERPDFAEKYLALTRNLSACDVREINKILWRISEIKRHPEQKLFNFYSTAEQEEKKKLQIEYKNKILAISDNLYVYDQYKLPINHFEACVFLYRHGIELVKDKTSLRDKDFIDAGAFIGDSALVLSEYTDKRIYSFEINPENIKNLHKTIELNNLTQVTVVEKALYDSETEMELNLSPMISAASLDKLPGIPYEEKTVKIPAITLDKFVRENNLHVGLIKTDLEGAELAFLKGAKQTIEEQKPVLLLSVYHKPSDFFELKPLLENWVPDYEFAVFKPVDNSILLETMIIAQPRR